MATFYSTLTFFASLDQPTVRVPLSMVDKKNFSQGANNNVPCPSSPLRPVLPSVPVPVDVCIAVYQPAPKSAIAKH